VVWINLAQFRDILWVLENTIMNLWIPEMTDNLLTSYATVRFLRKTLVHGVI